MFHEIDAENLGEVFQFCDYTRDEKLYNLSVLSKVFLFVVIMNEREKVNVILSLSRSLCGQLTLCSTAFFSLITIFNFKYQASNWKCNSHQLENVGNVYIQRQFPASLVEWQKTDYFKVQHYPT